MATSRRLHRFDTNQSIFVTFLTLICLLLFALPALSEDKGNEAASSNDQASAAAPASKPDFWHQQYLLGDWGGARTRLAEDKGITFDFHYFGDFIGVPEARIKTGAGAWNRVRGTMDIDFGKLAGWKGLTFHVTGLWQGGPNMGGDYLGSISNPSTLVSARTEMLDSYWLAYSMLDDKVTVRFGQFASMDYYGLPPWIWHFMMEPLSYGFQNRFNDYASFDPASGPGGQLIVTPNKYMYYSFAYTSGNRNPYVQDPNGFHFVKHDSGVLSDAVGFKINQPGQGKTAKEKYYPGQYEVGSTYNGGKFANSFCAPTAQVSGCPPVGSPYYSNPLYFSPFTGNYVVYFLGNQAVYRMNGSPNRGLDVVGGASFSPNAPYNFTDKTVLAGLTFNGPAEKRLNDSVNFGFSYTHVSDKYNNYFLAANPGAPPYSSEKAFEVNYLFQATPYWYIQPTVQWYAAVGGISQAGTGVAVGFRTKVTF